MSVAYDYFLHGFSLGGRLIENGDVLRVRFPDGKLEVCSVMMVNGEPYALRSVRKGVLDSVSLRGLDAERAA